MKIKVIAVGNVKEAYYRSMADGYMKEIRKRHEIQLTELPDESIPKNAGATQEARVKTAEGRRILERIDSRDYVYALCIDGAASDTKSLKQHIAGRADIAEGSLCFVIGGSLGLSDEVIKRADYKLSFSRLTFPHQLMRVLLLEQLAKICAS